MQSLEKPHRVVDKKLIKQMTGGTCEYCYSPAYGQSHHIKTVGSGGPDIPENLIQLSCANACHDKAHRGLISKDVLFSIVAKRENITVDECKRRVREAQGRC